MGLQEALLGVEHSERQSVYDTFITFAQGGSSGISDEVGQAHSVAHDLNPDYLAFIERQRSSLDALERQWALGATEALRTCSLRNKQEAIRRWETGLPFKLAEVKPKQNARCQSAACRPGDPMGCSQVKARMNASRTAETIRGWLEIPTTRALVGAFDVVAMESEGLADLVVREQVAFTKIASRRVWMLGGSDGTNVGGYFSTFAAFRRRGRWVTRRWVVLGLDSRGPQDWDERLVREWARLTSTPRARSEFAGWAPIPSKTFGAVAADINGVRRASGWGREMGVVERLGLASADWEPESADLEEPDFIEWASALSKKPTWQGSYSTTNAHAWNEAVSRAKRKFSDHLEKMPAEWGEPNRA